MKKKTNEYSIAPKVKGQDFKSIDFAELNAMFELILKKIPDDEVLKFPKKCLIENQLMK